MPERVDRDSLLRPGEEFYWQCPNERCRAAFSAELLSALAAERPCPHCGQELEVDIRPSATAPRATP